MKFKRDYVIRRTLIIFYCVLFGFIIWRFIVPRTLPFMIGSAVLLVGALIWLIWQMDELEIKNYKMQEKLPPTQPEPGQPPLEMHQDGPADEQAPQKQEDK